MSLLEVTSLSTKGQIVIPNTIREEMNLEPGIKMIIIQDGENILIKPIKKPALEQFKKLIEIGNEITDEINLDESEINSTMKEFRTNARRH